MTRQEITPKNALERLGSSSAEAIEQVLQTLAPGSIDRGEVTVLADGASPFAALSPGMIATSVSYVDGVSGANIFVLTPAGARKLAQAMGLPPSEEAQDSSLSELELSAVAEATNQMMAATASAIGGVLGNQIEISPPDTRVLDDPARAIDIYGKAPHATSTTFVIAGESCRLIQLVPKAFVMRLVRAIDDLDAVSSAPEKQGAGAGAAIHGLQAVLGETKLRVWAELGRTRMPLGRALTLPLGAVVDLDQAADAPVQLFVNGVVFAHGRLVVSDGQWALRIDQLQGDRTASLVPNQLEGALT